MKKILIIALCSISIINLNGKTLKEEIKFIIPNEPDSVIISMIPFIMTAKNITRIEFDDLAHIRVDTVIHDKVIIDSIKTMLLNCTIDSILPYDGNFSAKQARFYGFHTKGKKKNKYSFLWFDEDDLDLRCRIIIPTKSKGMGLVIWLADYGVMDIDCYRCSDKGTLMRFLRRLTNTTPIVSCIEDSYLQNTNYLIPQTHQRRDDLAAHRAKPFARARNRFQFALRHSTASSRQGHHAHQRQPQKQPRAQMERQRL